MSEPLVFPMTFVYRMCLLMLSGLGWFAVVACGAALLNLVEIDGSDTEQWVGVTVGLLLQPFAITALRNARVTLTEDRLGYLHCGVLCKTAQVPLAAIEAYGTGIERLGRVRARVLVLALTDGRSCSIKLGMYEHNQRFLEALERLTGKPPAATRQTLVGVRLDDRG